MRESEHRLDQPTIDAAREALRSFDQLGVERPSSVNDRDNEAAAKQRRAAQNALAREHLNDRQQDRDLRKKIAKWTLALVAAQLVAVDLFMGYLLYECPVEARGDLHTPITVFIGATFGQVMVAYVAVTRSLFRHAGNGDSSGG